MWRLFRIIQLLILRIKQLDDQISKEDEEFKNMQKKYYESRANLQKSQSACQEEISNVWNNSPNYKQYKNACDVLFEYTSCNKIYYIGLVTLTSIAKDHLIKTLEKQLDCALFSQRNTVIKNISLAKTIKVQD